VVKRHEKGSILARRIWPHNVNKDSKTRSETSSAQALAHASGIAANSTHSSYVEGDLNVTSQAACLLIVSHRFLLPEKLSGSSLDDQPGSEFTAA
jgi:hypothetical protein